MSRAYIQELHCTGRCNGSLCGACIDSGPRKTTEEATLEVERQAEEHGWDVIDELCGRCVERRIEDIQTEVKLQELEPIP